MLTYERARALLARMVRDGQRTELSGFQANYPAQDAQALLEFVERQHGELEEVRRKAGEKKIKIGGKGGSGGD
jgi:hypothetical protein